VFDAIGAAKARGADVLIADTAGRLPTQLHLMEEIRKVKRVIANGRLYDIDELLHGKAKGDAKPKSTAAPASH